MGLLWNAGSLFGAKHLWKLADALDEIGVPAGLVSWWGSKPLGLLDVGGRVSRLIVWLDD